MQLPFAFIQRIPINPAVLLRCQPNVCTADTVHRPLKHSAIFLDKFSEPPSIIHYKRMIIIIIMLQFDNPADSKAKDFYKYVTPMDFYTHQNGLIWSHSGL